MPFGVRRNLLIGLFTCLAVSGCSSGLRLGKVTGRVTVGGKAITAGVIMFHPAAGPTAVGAIQSDGAYSLTTIQAGDGAVIGPHRVTIEATQVGEGKLVEPKTPAEEIEMHQKRPAGSKVLLPGQVTWAVPQRYSRLETTDLTANVQRGSNSFDFEIPVGP